MNNTNPPQPPHAENIPQLPDAEFWKRKLAAYLHDPPSKALDIRTHGERSDEAFRAAGFVDQEIGEYFKHADHTGAAIDRIPFPNSSAANISCAFDGIRNAFIHPLGSGNPQQPLKLPFAKEFPSAELGIEGSQSVQPILSQESLNGLANDAERWRARFFAHWRLWRKHAVEKDYRLGLLPADTRIPDHSIWTHMQVVSALAGCVQQIEDDQLQWHPAFLKVQIGGVQEFIAQARSTRDLWSGSYLLSWLMAAGLKRLSELVGPDAVIYPNLQGQPLFDLMWRDELWSKVSIGEGIQTVWERLKHDDKDLLTPNLPNVFLAVVPAKRARDYAEAVLKAIRDEWKRIAAAVWEACDRVGLMDDEGSFTKSQRKERFDRQVEQFLSISWQVNPWPATLNDALKLAGGFNSEMPVAEAKKRVQAIIKMATQDMDHAHRDGRFYEGGDQGPKTKLNNVGLGWSIILALNGWQLDAVRQTRAFKAANPGQWQVGVFNNKDSLNGKDEAVAGGETWFNRAINKGRPWSILFKHNDWMGAVTLIKRVWHLAYLRDKWRLRTDGENFKMPSTRGIAAHEPFSDGDEEDPENTPASEKYFAVLALDGDEIGKWVSGQKTPNFATQLADYYDANGTVRQGVKGYFEQPRFGGFLQTQRPLSASYHLQFSETLSNFALQCARPIVEVFDGRLIYAGGDDVVALLPADSALACARCLRMAFRGDTGLKDELQRNAAKLRKGGAANQDFSYQQLAEKEGLLDAPHAGVIARLEEGKLDDNHKPIPVLVPGPAADCSVGIAIAHFKAPLQDVVRAAQAAEKRAKRQLGRGAVAVTLMKHSGEIIEWGCQWKSGGLEAFEAMVEALHSQAVSAKFPHRIIELVANYQAEVENPAPCQKRLGETRPYENFHTVVDDVLQKEIGTAAERQKGKKPDASQVKQVQDAVATYLAAISDSSNDPVRTAQLKVAALIGLCQTVAFTHRISED
ncbi:type III-B CRISPR-associated protein Cas10/Cmr2 [Fontisphaera persica]|uniref:type III-B CRISPR-associated protein Cas10/Cmr2 n=1 Tax=Fontisphaera persica TaxID=2974023 RepID=UPI0024BFC351|nr:type III-B CRISPR-associated protein Cas10/Cmr2 [Fontisphaera persica]WCJ60674.1 type III-B CRISPR-associated protein Cas10/Cmr2 [Fontisphaera persica]